MGNILLVNIEKEDGTFSSVDNEESIQYLINIMVICQYAFTVSIEGIIYSKTDACDKICDRLKVFMKKLNFHPFFVISYGQSAQTSAAETNLFNKTQWSGQVSKIIEIMEEGFND